MMPLWSALCIFRSPSIFGQPSWLVLAEPAAATTSDPARAAATAAWVREKLANMGAPVVGVSPALLTPRRARTRSPIVAGAKRRLARRARGDASVAGPRGETRG